MLGVAERDAVPPPVIHDQEEHVQGSASCPPEHVDGAVEIIRSEAITKRDFITYRGPLDRVAETFALSVEGEQSPTSARTLDAFSRAPTWKNNG